MKIPSCLIICCIFFGLIFPAYALEPTKPGIDLRAWAPGSSSTTIAEGQPILFENSVQSWWNQPWGKRDTRVLQNSNLINLGFRQRLLSTPGNTIVDASVGIKTVGFGHHESRDSLRLSLGGQMGFGELLTLYGESAWMPGLIESNGFNELSGLEFETGVLFYPLPNLSIHAAYRRLNLDYTLSNGSGEHSFTEGIVFGTGIHW